MAFQKIVLPDSEFAVFNNAFKLSDNWRQIFPLKNVVHVKTKAGHFTDKILTAKTVITDF